MMKICLVSMQMYDDNIEDNVIRCKTGPQACIMVWPDGYQGVSSYDYA